MPNDQEALDDDLCPFLFGLTCSPTPLSPCSPKSSLLSAPLCLFTSLFVFLTQTHSVKTHTHSTGTYSPSSVAKNHKRNILTHITSSRQFQWYTHRTGHDFID